MEVVCCWQSFLLFFGGIVIVMQITTFYVKSFSVIFFSTAIRVVLIVMEIALKVLT